MHFDLWSRELKVRYCRNRYGGWYALIFPKESISDAPMASLARVEASTRWGIKRKVKYLIRKRREDSVVFFDFIPAVDDKEEDRRTENGC